MKSRLAAIFKQVTLKLLVAVVTFILVLYGFAALAHEVFLEKEEEMDVKVFNYLSQFKTKDIINAMRFLSLFGKPEFMIPGYLLIIGLLVYKKKKNQAIETAIMGTSSTLLLFFLKGIFERNRPPYPVLSHLSGYSFPSGHALLTFVFCSVVIYLVWKSKLKPIWQWSFSVLLVLFSIAVGISRIVLRVHYASDVIAGFCLGYTWVILALWVQQKYLQKNGIKNDNGNNA